MFDTEGYQSFVEDYESLLLDELGERTHSKTAPDWFEGEASSVLSGLLSRQATLSLSLVKNPLIWNEHVAPLILRVMIDAVITFRWILKDPKTRAQEYIGYGLGQAKLAISHLEKKVEEDPEDDLPSRMIDFKKMWIDSQRLMPFVEVNLGSWSGRSVRQMAIEAGDEDLYNFAFTPFSSCVHNHWDHVHIFNTVRCDNPLHKYHRIAAIMDPGISDDYVFRSAKYFDLTLNSFDVAAGMSRPERPMREYFLNNISRIYEAGSSSDKDDHPNVESTR